MRNSKLIWGQYAWMTFLDNVAESGRFSKAGLTPIQSVLAANSLEVFIVAAHLHMLKSLQNT